MIRMKLLTRLSATILLIDDHPMLRNGVRQLISMEPSLTVAGEAGNGRDGIAPAESLDPIWIPC